MAIYLPAINRLSNPHLLIIGDEGNASLAILSDLARNADAIAYIGHLPELDGRDGRRYAISTIDLLGALMARREGSAVLRDHVIRLAGENDGDEYQAASLFESITGGGMEDTMLAADGCRIPVVFPADADAGTASQILSDMDENASRHGLPEPTVVVKRREIPAKAAIVEFDAKRYIPKECVVMMPVRDERDWKPYAAAGMLPELDDGQQQAAVEMKVAEYRSGGIYADVGEEELTQIASRHLDDVIWRVAAMRAVPASTRRSMPSREIIMRFKEGGMEAIGAKLEGFLAGGRQVPPMWERGGAWLFDPALCSEQRLSTFIHILMDEASEYGNGAKSKAIVIDGSSIDISPAVDVALVHVLRTARKHNLHLILIVPDGKAIASLGGWFGNKIATWDYRDHIRPGLTAPDGEAPYGVAEIGGQEPTIMERWYDRPSVVDGHRIITSGTTTNN